MNYEDLNENSSRGCELEVCEDLRVEKKTFLTEKCRSIVPIIKMAISSIVLLLANYLYLSANINCPYPNDQKCGSNFIKQNMFVWIVRFVTLSILFALLIFLGFSSNIVPRKISIAAVISIIYLTFVHNRSNEHGNYSVFFGFYTRLLILFLLGLFYLSRFLIRSFKRWPTLTLFTTHIVLAMGGTALYRKFADSCSTWDHGLDGERVVYDTTTCNLKKPDLCIYDIKDGLVDYTKILRWDCTTFPNHWELMNQFFGPHPLVGYPRTEYISDQDRYDNEILKYLQRNLVSIESLEDEKAKDIEIFVDRRNPKDPKYIIKVKRNETLVEERSKIKSPSVTKNLLVLYPSHGGVLQRTEAD